MLLISSMSTFTHTTTSVGVTLACNDASIFHQAGRNPTEYVGCGLSVVCCALSVVG